MNTVLKAIKKYGTLYMIKFEDDHAVVFRIIPWGQFTSYRNLATSFPVMEDDIKEDLFSECVIEYHSPFTSYKKGKLKKNDIISGYIEMNNLLHIIPAGVVDVISNAIMRISGSTSPDMFMNDLAEARGSSEIDMEDRVTAIMSTVFGYKEEDYNKMNYERILNLVAQGEMIFNKEIPDMPFTLDNGKAQAIDFKSENRNSLLG